MCAAGRFALRKSVAFEFGRQPSGPRAKANRCGNRCADALCLWYTASSDTHAGSTFSQYLPNFCRFMSSRAPYQGAIRLRGLPGAGKQAVCCLATSLFPSNHAERIASMMHYINARNDVSHHTSTPPVIDKQKVMHANYLSLTCTLRGMAESACHRYFEVVRCIAPKHLAMSI